MTKLLALLAIFVSACAARAPESTLPMQYNCDDHQVTTRGDALLVASNDPKRPSNVKLGWVDDDGHHFISWPLVPTHGSTVEYVIPSDTRSDAVVREYDVTGGQSIADWRLLHHDTCTAKGGYTDVLARFASGTSMAELAAQLNLGDRSAARALVHDAMIKLQRRYYADR